MGFLTNVDDLKRKNELIYNLIFGKASIVTIVASGPKNDLEPLEKIYQDREFMDLSEYSDDFSIIENITNNPDESYNATLTFIKKASR